MEWFLYDNGLRHERVKSLFNWHPAKIVYLLLTAVAKQVNLQQCMVHPFSIYSKLSEKLLFLTHVSGRIRR